MYFASDTAGSMFSRDIPIIRNLVQNMKRNNVLKLNLIGRTPIGRVCHRFVLFRTKLQAKASTHIFPKPVETLLDNCSTRLTIRNMFV